MTSLSDSAGVDCTKKSNVMDSSATFRLLALLGFRHLSPSIVSKRIYLAVNVTVSWSYAVEKDIGFKLL